MQKINEVLLLDTKKMCEIVPVRMLMNTDEPEMIEQRRVVTDWS